MKHSIIFTFVCIILIFTSCHKELATQSIAGYIDAASDEQKIVVNVIDSAEVLLPAPCKMSFAIDDNTTYESKGLVEGNIAEIIYQPSREEGIPAAIEINTDDTYPRALGRWCNGEQNRLRIDIELLPNGKIFQHLPTQTLKFQSWQLSKQEDVITIIGEVSLPPIIEPKAKSKSPKLSNKRQSDSPTEESTIAPPARRRMQFTTTAAIGIEGDRRTLTILNDRKEQSVLYRIE